MNFPGSITSKFPQMATTIFTKMSALAAEHKAINLSQGFPDFPVNQYLIDRVHHHMTAGANQYAPMGGMPQLTQAIAKKVKRYLGAEYNPQTEITVTAGGTQALASTIAAVVREGDEVIIFTPAYDSYTPVVELHGGRPVYIKLKFPEYNIDWDEVKMMITRKTKLIIINSPHNPTGTVLRKEDLDALAHLVANSNILVLSDEVYEHITFDGLPHVSAASHPILAERSFVVFSFGKTFHATGWKLGYVLAPENLMKEFRKIHQYDVFSCNAPIQRAMADFMEYDEVFHIKDMYQQKRDFFLEQIKGSRLKPLPSSGTYFQLLDYSAITQEADVDFAVRLTVENKLASIPVSVFYNTPTDNKVLRFCFAKEEETLIKAGEILKSL